MVPATGASYNKAFFTNVDTGGVFYAQFNPKEFKLDEKAIWKASDEHDEQDDRGDGPQELDALGVVAGDEVARGAHHAAHGLGEAPVVHLGLDPVDLAPARPRLPLHPREVGARDEDGRGDGDRPPDPLEWSGPAPTTGGFDGQGEGEGGPDRPREADRRGGEGGQPPATLPRREEGDHHGQQAQ